MSEKNDPPSTPDSNCIRLNRYCAQCGLGSRRSCDTLIASGRIKVNGKPITELGVKIDPHHDKVEYNGNIVLPVRPPLSIAYCKPRGVIVTKHDPQGRETVFDALEKAGHDVSDLRYIGRLDYDSEGLLLLTNDGPLVHALTHPRFHIKKVYEVCIDRILKIADCRKMTLDGIVSEDQVLRTGNIVSMDLKTIDGHWYSIDLYEGKKRQIRRIFEALGYTVKRLKRIQFASIKIGTLQPGESRVLTQREVSSLHASGYPLK